MRYHQESPHFSDTADVPPDEYAPEPEVSEGETEYSVNPADAAKLRRLYQLSLETRDADDFLDYLDDVAFTFICRLYPKEVEENIRMVKGGNADKQIEGKTRQLALLDTAKQHILRVCDIDMNAGKSAFEMAREHIRETVAHVPEGDANATLLALGILKKDHDGQDRFSYPLDLMPEDTNLKWQTYVAAVRRHLEVNNGLLLGISTQQDVVEADRQRRVAHDAVSVDIAKLLDLRHPDSTPWTVEKVRHLVAKMREMRFPNKDTSEAARTEQALRYFHESHLSNELLTESNMYVPGYGRLFDPNAPKD